MAEGFQRCYSRAESDIGRIAYSISLVAFALRLQTLTSQVASLETSRHLKTGQTRGSCNSKSKMHLIVDTLKL